MSGTSLDGLDLCLTRFWSKKKQWKYEIVEAATLQYSDSWLERLIQAPDSTAEELHLSDREFGHYLGALSKQFLQSHREEADLIASHGHTIFHQPEQKMSVQIGHGAFIAASSGIDVVSDFRANDTAYGGEGAPLVPLAEKWLFKSHKSFLNVGGIANLSVHADDGQVLGFDVCPANQVLNWISRRFFDKEYDDYGKLAAKGKLIPELLKSLNQLDFYDKAPPRSLGREFVEMKILPLLENYSDGKNLLHTYTQHMVYQIATCIAEFRAEPPVFLSGGGVHNHFFIESLKETGVKVFLADDKLIDFKEALCFSLLGLLRMHALPNSLASVSGASKDSVGGSHFLA